MRGSFPISYPQSSLAELNPTHRTLNRPETPVPQKPHDGPCEAV